ncbi:hypothetical protein IX329_000983 [Fusobacterium necrophorum]|nr:hypothetical protein [Fusobacterium necrophorum]MBR8733409.1 hypothetical protein [Fusobacterium necrophorum]MBR8789586.1 hypothetical protein [Fusobacterium necrophorum]
MENYIKQYKKALETPENIKNQRLIKFSTLQYFHKELNIELNQEKSIVTDKENPEVSKEDPWKKKLENDKIKGLSLGE